jgi:hypothetical protein
MDCITKSTNCNRRETVEGILGALYKKQEEAFASFAIELVYCKIIKRRWMQCKLSLF